MKLLIMSNMYPSVEKPFAGIYVKNLSDYLAEIDGYDVSVMAMERKYTGLLGTIKKYVCFFLGSMRHLRTKYDVVHLHFFYPLCIWGYFYKLLHSDSKLVVTFHGSDINANFNGAISSFIGKQCAKKFDYFISVGDELKATAERKLNVSVSSVMPAGIDEKTFFPRKSTLRKYDFIFVGSFTRLKGLDQYLASLKLFNTKLKLCFVGSGPLSDSIEELKVTHSVDMFYDLKQNEIAELYASSKFLVVPSRTEAFGLVVSEAMYCGTPVLANNIGGIKMQLDDAVNGFFFHDLQTGSINKVLTKALDLSNDEYQKISANSLTSNKEYSLSNILRAHLSIYKRLTE